MENLSTVNLDDHTVFSEASVTNELFTVSDYLPEVEVSRMVSGSFLEKVVLCIYFALCVAYVPSANSLIIHVVLKTPALQTPQYFFICCYAMCDLLFSVTTHTMSLGALIWDLTDIPEWLCRLHGTVHAGIFFSSFHALGLIAYERYFRFSHPLAYIVYFTKNRLVLFAVMPHVFGQGLSLFIDLYIGRQYFTTILACNAASPQLVYLTPIMVCLFYLPSALMSLICLIKLIVLVKRQHAKNIGLGNMNGHLSQSLGIRRAIKIVMLVSGSFWITAAEAFIARSILFSSGVTWADMDTRHNLTAYIICRTSSLLVSTASLLINPVIYLTLHRELRKACRKNCLLLMQY